MVRNDLLSFLHGNGARFRFSAFLPLAFLFCLLTGARSNADAAGSAASAASESAPVLESVPTSPDTEIPVTLVWLLACAANLGLLVLKGLSNCWEVVLKPLKAVVDLSQVAYSWSAHLVRQSRKGGEVGHRGRVQTPVPPAQQVRSPVAPEHAIIALRLASRNITTSRSESAGSSDGSPSQNVQDAAASGHSMDGKSKDIGNSSHSK